MLLFLGDKKYNCVTKISFLPFASPVTLRYLAYLLISSCSSSLMSFISQKSARIMIVLKFLALELKPLSEATNFSVRYSFQGISTTQSYVLVEEL